MKIRKYTTVDMHEAPAVFASRSHMIGLLFVAGGTSSGAYGSSQGVRDLLGGLFHYVNVDPPNLQEQMVILGAKHPVLTSLLPHAMATLSLFHAAYGPSGSGLSSDQQQSKLRTQCGKEAGWDADVHAALSAAGLRAGELGFSVGRHFSLRDLAKWCRRMEAVHSALLARSLKPGLYPEYQRSVSAMPLAIREAAFCEAADCFCGLVGKAEVSLCCSQGSKCTPETSLGLTGREMLSGVCGILEKVAAPCYSGVSSHLHCACHS